MSLPYFFTLLFVTHLNAWAAPQAVSTIIPGDEKKATEPQPAPKKAPGVIQLLGHGQLGLKQLKKFSYVSGKVLARDKSYTVYAGFRDPVFQVVLWGASERPERVLLEFDPKKTTMDTLRDFNADFASAVGLVKAVASTMESLSKENAEHLKAYCAKLPASAKCSVDTYALPAGKLVRVDIHLSVGPAVPKAIEFRRAH